MPQTQQYCAHAATDTGFDIHKFMDRKNTSELMERLGSEKAVAEVV